MAAVFPIHQPRALFHAHGFLPVEVWGPPSASTRSGDAHVQAYACSIVRCGLSFVMDGGLEVADVIAVPHACDSLQGLGTVLMDFTRPGVPVLPLYLPRGERASDVAFLADELRALGRRLVEITGVQPTDADVLEAVRVDEEADDVLRDLHARRRFLPMDDPAFYALVRTREYLPPEGFAALGREALAEARDEPVDDGAVPILLSGIVSEPTDVLEALADAGGRVVADDLACTGRRLYPNGRSYDPWERMAERLLGGPPDPTRGSPIAARVRHLLDLAERTGARGVVFYTVKFCEPELFDLPLLRQGLQAEGLRSVEVEVDVHTPLDDQTVTRLKAFLETLPPGGSP
ncbi:MAG: 2-hydroxyacyl-CoA dehydratase subunit D [Myxococcota bacterium]